MRRLEASPRRAAPKGQTFISRAAPHQTGSPTSSPSPRSGRTLAQRQDRAASQTVTDRFRPLNVTGPPGIIHLDEAIALLRQMARLIREAVHLATTPCGPGSRHPAAFKGREHNGSAPGAGCPAAAIRPTAPVVQAAYASSKPEGEGLAGRARSTSPAAREVAASLKHNGRHADTTAVPAGHRRAGAAGGLVLHRSAGQAEPLARRPDRIPAGGHRHLRDWRDRQNHPDRRDRHPDPGPRAVKQRERSGALRLRRRRRARSSAIHPGRPSTGEADRSASSGEFHRDGDRSLHRR